MRVISAGKSGRVLDDTGLGRTQTFTSMCKGEKEAIVWTALSSSSSAAQVREQSNAKPKRSPVSACSGTAGAQGTSKNRDELSLRASVTQSIELKHHALGRDCRAALTHLVVRRSWRLVHIPGNRKRKSSNPTMSINRSCYPSLLPKHITHFTVALDFRLMLFCVVQYEEQQQGDEIPGPAAALWLHLHYPQALKFLTDWSLHREEIWNKS